MYILRNEMTKFSSKYVYFYWMVSEALRYAALGDFRMQQQLRSA